MTSETSLLSNRMPTLPSPSQFETSATRIYLGLHANFNYMKVSDYAGTANRKRKRWNRSVTLSSGRPSVRPGWGLTWRFHGNRRGNADNPLTHPPPSLSPRPSPRREYCHIVTFIMCHSLSFLQFTVITPFPTPPPTYFTTATTLSSPSHPPGKTTFVPKYCYDLY